MARNIRLYPEQEEERKSFQGLLTVGLTGRTEEEDTIFTRRIV